MLWQDPLGPRQQWRLVLLQGPKQKLGGSCWSLGATAACSQQRKSRGNTGRRRQTTNVDSDPSSVHWWRRGQRTTTVGGALWQQAWRNGAKSLRGEHASRVIAWWQPLCMSPAWLGSKAAKARWCKNADYKKINIINMIFFIFWKLYFPRNKFLILKIFEVNINIYYFNNIIFFGFKFIIIIFNYIYFFVLIFIFFIFF